MMTLQSEKPTKSHLKQILVVIGFLLLIIILQKFAFRKQEDIESTTDSKVESLINLPVSDFVPEMSHFIGQDLVICIKPEDQIDESSKPNILLNGRTVSILQLDKELNKLLSVKGKSTDFGVKFFIDSGVKMEIVQEIKKLLLDKKIFRVRYGYKNLVMLKELKPVLFLTYYMPQISAEYGNYIEIDCSTDVVFESCEKDIGYKINDMVVNSDDLTNSIKKLIFINPDSKILLITKKENSFGEYFNMLSASRKAVYELRNELALKVFSKDFNSLNRILQQILRPYYMCREIDAYEDWPVNVVLELQIVE